MFSDADVFKKKTMVFVSRKVFADTLGVLLCQAGIPSTTIHGDRGQGLRAEAINDFKYGRKAVGNFLSWTLLCVKMASR